MSKPEITPESVLAAISAGHDDVDKLARQFGVAHSSHTLRMVIAGLGAAGRIKRYPVPGSPTPRFEVTS